MGLLRKLLPLLLVLLFPVTVFAAGNLTVFSLPLSPNPVYVNTNQSVNVLNLSLNVTISNGDSLVNITSINITINSSSEGGTPGNISAVEIRNSTGFPIGRNATLNPANNITFTIFIPGGFTVNTSNATILIALNISRSATRQANISANLTASTEIGTNATTNITITGNSIRSNGVQIQDLHANATISPRFVDTRVENQTFFYLFNITGLDSVTTFSINLPSGYTLINLTTVERGGSPPANLTPGSDYTNTTLSNQINVSLVSVTAQYVKIYFLANTSSTIVSSVAFTSNITGSNLTAVATDAVLNNLTNVTTTNIINLTTVSISKGVAVLNGSDYWEFNFTTNFSETVTGTLHFKMTNWTDSNNNLITLASCTPSCATIRQDTNASLNTSKINITNNFDPNYGLGMSPARGNLTTLFLRMIVPAGSAVSQSWFATYVLLFRATP